MVKAKKERMVTVECLLAADCAKGNRTTPQMANPKSTSR